MNFCLNFLSLLSDRDKTSKDIFHPGHESCSPKMSYLCDISFQLSLSFVSAWHKLTESLTPANTNSHIELGNFKVSSNAKILISANKGNVEKKSIKFYVSAILIGVILQTIVITVTTRKTASW